VIGGTVGNGVTGAISISIGAGSANNQANILSSGFVHAINVAAVDLSGAADGNVFNNAGTISSASGTAIIGSANQDTIINSGTIISGGVSTAADLKGGNDVFELRAGSRSRDGSSAATERTRCAWAGLPTQRSISAYSVLPVSSGNSRRWKRPAAPPGR
jgi:hypothetical protein